jgi:CO dehydrogenase maturation factor
MKVVICGKGGCGKSTVTALLAAAMAKRNKKVLVVDADESNIGLYRMLGFETPKPLMDALGGKKGFGEKTNKAGNLLGGSPKLFPDAMKLEHLPLECVASSKNLRVMSVGKIHHFGEGCACPMGKLFKMVFSSLTLEKEELVIVDTAAGVEHFGRRLDGDCDLAFCVVDPSYESIMMAKRVNGLAEETGLPVFVILNKMTPQIETEIVLQLDTTKTIGRIPNSESIFLKNLKGEALLPDIPEIDPICDTIEAAWKH